MDLTILIVDDSSFIVDGLAAILKRKGYTTLAAHGGDECIRILQTVKPDLILLDIMMEPMDGWETLGKIKENSVTKEIPVLMFSAKKITLAEAQEHSMNLDDFVSKPVSPSQLLDSIQRIFSRRNDVKGEVLVAQSKGIDPVVIDEYSALRKSVEVDKNLLVVLRSSRGMDIPGRDVLPEDVDAIRKLEDKISTSERRLREINELLAKTA
ncbi:response regulator [Methanoregula sp.]|jgi:CheY-like chemotaxis protein|uniref:response regulator n=1 Tax=Methanoregula sp. TaxID=2052170 RepID=UPI00356AEE8C